MRISFDVDDSEGVAKEGRRYRFDVLVIAPDDEDWCDRVRAAIDLLSRIARDIGVRSAPCP